MTQIAPSVLLTRTRLYLIFNVLFLRSEFNDGYKYCVSEASRAGAGELEVGAMKMEDARTQPLVYCPTAAILTGHKRLAKLQFAKLYFLRRALR